MLSKGKILLAEPYIGDSNFERSVIVLCETNDTGACGFILNKKTAFTVNQLMDEIFEPDPHVYIGGPVEQDSIYFIIQSTTKPIDDCIQIYDDLYWGGDFEALKAKIYSKQIHVEQCRFFLGYSGWSENQLEIELNRNHWIITDTSADVLLKHEPDELWRYILQKMGNKYKVFANAPTDPRLN
jgi:putative transcriptional regulator